MLIRKILRSKMTTVIKASCSKIIFLFLSILLWPVFGPIKVGKANSGFEN